MNIAQLLAYGPKLEKTYCESRPKTEYSTHRVSEKTIDKYRSFSVDNKIWVTLVESNIGITQSSASGNLRDLLKRGYLKQVGRYKESKSSNKPIVYEWV